MFCCLRSTTDFEIRFVRLLEKLTNGSTVEINYTGTSLLYRPGTMRGGKMESFDCGEERAIGYFLEPLLAVLPFSKLPVDLLLTGITNSEQDITVDTLRTVTIPLMKRFGMEDGLEVKVRRARGPWW